MDFYRIQDKIISWQKIEKTIKKALLMRSRGMSQQEVAEKIGIDRTFLSRIEGLGELRKGQSIACVGFPIKNKEEIEALLKREGVDYIFLMTERERQDFIQKKSGRELLNEIMDLITRFRSFDVVICIGSDERIKLIEGVLTGQQVISMEIGTSPITEDKWVDPREIEKILRMLKSVKR